MGSLTFSNKSHLKKLLGRKAEEHVANLYREKGYSVQMSDDEFDEEKDMIIHYKLDESSYPYKRHVEVKFQTLYYYAKVRDSDKPFKAFSIPIEDKAGGHVYSNQLNKFVHADTIIIVQNPLESFGETTIKTWKAPRSGYRNFQLTRNKNDGRIVALFPLSQFDLFDEREDEEFLKLVREHRVCNWR